jgi:isopentenyl-diphosphate delta-isomerase
VSDISGRKADHITLTVEGDVGYRKNAGFEQFDFVHNALPGINFGDVSLTSVLLGRSFAAPAMIASMTGGYAQGKAINRSLANVARQLNIPLGLGSQRAMIERPELAQTFMEAREAAPDIFLAANIGGVQIRDVSFIENVLKAAALVKANAIIVHLNPLQEMMQPEGDRDFSGVLEGIRQLCKATALPVIVKETGAGISRPVAAMLLAAGVKAIDVAGAGGTSWAAVEMQRHVSAVGPDDAFLREWGIPTAVCLQQIAPLQGAYSFDLISSGGVYGASEILKSLALGASFTTIARPVIQVLVQHGESALLDWFHTLFYQLKTGLLLLGVTSPSQLTPHHLRHVTAR